MEIYFVPDSRNGPHKHLNGLEYRVKISPYDWAKIVQHNSQVEHDLNQHIKEFCNDNFRKWYTTGGLHPLSKRNILHTKKWYDLPSTMKRFFFESLHDRDQFLEHFKLLKIQTKLKYYE